MEANSDKVVKITITLPGSAYFRSGIRDFTLGLIKNTTTFDEKWAFRFQSIVDELCNNAVEFGSSKEEEIKIIFSYKEGEYIEISVEDTGTGKNKVKAKDLYDLVEERSKPGYIVKGIRGRGLSMIVKSWVDDLKFEDTEKGGIKVVIKKSMKPDRKNDQNLTSSVEIEKDPTKIIL